MKKMSSLNVVKWDNNINAHYVGVFLFKVLRNKNIITIFAS